MDIHLSLYETRVLGVLIEKKITTPDQYPLSLNALTNACNQKSNREPVLGLDESEVQEVIDGLVVQGFIVEDCYGSRVVKFKHRFCNTEFSQLQFTDQELAIICVLFLRGPQTPGELRTRTNRLCKFKDVREVESALNGLMKKDDKPYVKKLFREVGKRESRYAHLMSGDVKASGQASSYQVDKGQSSAQSSSYQADKGSSSVQPASNQTDKEQFSSDDERMTALEKQVEMIHEEIELIKMQLEMLP